MFLSDNKDQREKQFHFFFEEQGSWTSGNGFFRKDVTKKREKKAVDMRRHWSGFTLKSKFTQHKFHYTCNLALHKTLWRIQSSFLFLFQWWQKNLCVKVIDHSIVVLRFSDSPQFLDTLNWGNLSPWQTAMWWICGTTTSSCTTLSSKHHWQI